MPLAVDLLLLDEEGRASPGSYHVSTAKGIYSELERQLQDPRSHLKRKSAFGALIERGARLRFICHDEGRNARRSPSCPAALQTPETELAASGVTAEPVSKQLASPEATEGVSAALEGRNGQRSVTVPHIADFPQSQSGKPTTDHNGNGFFVLIAELDAVLCACPLQFLGAEREGRLQDSGHSATGDGPLCPSAGKRIGP